MGTERYIELPEDDMREELETAWLRGCRARIAFEGRISFIEYEQMAADYAERVVGGSTRPARPDRPLTPPKDENAA